MTYCIASIEGCEQCAERNASRDPDHECAAMCELAQSIMDTDKGHRIWHEPMRHRCGFILDDKRGGKFHGEPTLCWFGRCVQYFCPGCRRSDMGWGPIMCPCENSPHGHGTKGEYRRPRPPVKATQREPRQTHRRYCRHQPKKVRNPASG